MTTPNSPSGAGVPRRKVVFSVENRRALARATMSGGALAGLSSGLIMGVFAVLQNAWVGLGAWLPFQSMAALLYGVQAFVGGTPAVLIGLIVHLTTSVVFGMIYASMVTPRTSNASAFAGGLLFGGVIWALMTFVVLPIFNPVMSARVALTSGWWFFLHMIYGGCLAAAPTLIRSYAGRPVRREDRSAPGLKRAA